jgi:hypothetical protein
MLARGRIHLDNTHLGKRDKMLVLVIGHLSLQPSSSPCSIAVVLTPEIATAVWFAVTFQLRVLNRVVCMFLKTITSASTSDNRLGSPLLNTRAAAMRTTPTMKCTTSASDVMTC